MCKYMWPQGKKMQCNNRKIRHSFLISGVFMEENTQRIQDYSQVKYFNLNMSGRYLICMEGVLICCNYSKQSHGDKTTWKKLAEYQVLLQKVKYVKHNSGVTIFHPA